MQEMNKGCSDKFKVCAVVVTYNRKELLRECLQALLAQTRPLDEIIVIDNASTDGTNEMVLSEFPQVTYVRLPENTGGAGGFHEGMKLAYEKGHDWIWVMDDDAIPHKEALQHLVDEIEKRFKDEKFRFCFYSAYVSIDEKRFSEPITVYINGQKFTYLNFDEMLDSNIFEGEGGPFLGLMIPSLAIENIGLPCKETFIWGDYEYIWRLKNAGFKIYYNFASKIYHPIHIFKGILLPIGLIKFKRPIWRKFRVPLGPPWKQYYGIRNFIFFSMYFRRGYFNKVKIILQAILWTSIVVLYGRYNKMEMMKCCLKGLLDGLKGKMKICIKPNEEC